MPHVLVKLWPGNPERQRQALAVGVAKAVMASPGHGKDAISVSLEEVAPSDWTDEVYRPDITNGPGRLHEKPGCNPLWDTPCKAGSDDQPSWTGYARSPAGSPAGAQAWPEMWSNTPQARATRHRAASRCPARSASCARVSSRSDSTSGLIVAGADGMVGLMGSFLSGGPVGHEGR